MPLKRLSWKFWAATWVVLLGVWAIVHFCFDSITDSMFRQALGDRPEVVLAAVHGAKVSPKILARTGEITSESYNLRKLASQSDSLVLRIVLGGTKANATIKARAVKQASGIWKIYQSDTTFTY